MEIIIWVIFGALVGWIASAIMGSNEGLVLNIIMSPQIQTGILVAYARMKV